jgi:two-component system sensor histidine kinase KdpD
MGVLGLKLHDEGGALDFRRRQAVEAFALQLALVLEKEHFIQAVGQAEVLEKSENLRSNLLNSVSHELKTPLAIIRASIDGMGDAARDPYVMEIDTAAKRLQRIVDGLLQMTRLEAKVVEPKLEWCDVRELLDSAVKSAGEVLSAHPLEVLVAADIPLVKTDQTLLTQALANLLHNAVVYSAVEQPVKLSARFADQKLRLSVRDHGAGLPQGEEGRVFGKFYRAVGTPAGGTGLGLSIARGFVQALGGDVSCWNHPDGGAVFEILLRVEFMVPLEEETCVLSPSAETRVP